MIMIPAPPKPEPLFIALVDLLGFKNHLWDSSGQKIQDGLGSLYEKYVRLLAAIKHSIEFNGPRFTREHSIEFVDIKVPHLIASDTVLLWSSQVDVEFLIGAVSNLINLGLTFNVPLRGALAYGDCIIDVSKNIFIGYPIVEAIETEKCQNWIGIGVTNNAANLIDNMDGVVKYPVPLQSSFETNKSINISHAIAWHWAEPFQNDPDNLAQNIPNGPEIRLKRLLNSTRKRQNKI